MSKKTRGHEEIMDNNIVQELNKWFQELTPFLTGEKKWDTGCIWIFQTPDKVIERFVSQCEKSINPDLFTKLIEEIVPSLELAINREVKTEVDK